MRYFLKKNLIAIIVAIVIIGIGSIINLTEQTSYEDNSMSISSLKIDAIIDASGDLTIIETMQVNSAIGMSVFFRDIIYKKDSAGINTNISSFDNNITRVRIFDRNNSLIIDSNNGKTNSLAQIGFSFNNDRDERGDLVRCPSNYPSECVSLFSRVNAGTYPTTTYEYTYKIKGAISKFNDIAELNWIFVDDYKVKVENVEITLIYPTTNEGEVVRFYGHGTSNANGNIISYNSMRFSANILLPREVLEVRVILPSRIFVNAAAINTINKNYLAEMEAKEAAISFLDNLLFYLNILGYILILIIIGLAIFFFRFIYLKYDKEHIPEFKGDYYRELPATYSPAEMGYLYNFRELSKFDFSATLIDLIRRKFILLDYEGQGLTDKNANYKLKLNLEVSKDSLKAHETFLLEWFFKKISNNQNELTINQIEAYAKSFATAERYLMDNQKWISLAKSEASKNDFFDTNSEQIWHKYLLIPVAMIFIGILLFIGVISYVEFLMFQSINLLIAILVAIPIVMISYLVTIKRRSIKGNEEFVKWRAFKKFLEDFSNFKDYPMPSIIVWEHFLVYATSFGIADLVMKQLKLKFKELNLNEDEYYRRSPVLRYPFLWINLNRRMVNTTTIARNSVAQMRAQKAGSGRGSGGFGGGRSFGGGGGGIRGR
jgi:uncharacterized membrane protein